MKQNGFLVTYVDASNKRNKVVKLTQTAEKMSFDITDMVLHQEEKLLKGLTSEQIKELTEMLTIIYFIYIFFRTLYSVLHND